MFMDEAHSLTYRAVVTDEHGQVHLDLFEGLTCEDVLDQIYRKYYKCTKIALTYLYSCDLSGTRID